MMTSINNMPIDHRHRDSMGHGRYINGDLTIYDGNLNGDGG